MADNNKFQVRRKPGGRPYGMIPTGEKIHKLRGNYANAVAEPCCVPAPIVIVALASDLGGLAATSFYHPTIGITGLNNKTYTSNSVTGAAVDTQAQLVSALNTSHGMFGVFASVDATHISLTLDPKVASAGTMSIAVNTTPTADAADAPPPPADDEPGSDPLPPVDDPECL